MSTTEDKVQVESVKEVEKAHEHEEMDADERLLRSLGYKQVPKMIEEKIALYFYIYLIESTCDLTLFIYFCNRI
jgi:tRNA A37 N6-isopentenylltransferase MiaA